MPNQNKFSRRLFISSLLANCAILPLLPQITLAQTTLAKTTANLAKSNYQRQTQIFMNTLVSITINHADSEVAENAMSLAFEHGKNLAKLYTRFADDSLLTKLNQNGKLENSPANFLVLIEKAKKMHQLTDGYFDATILPLVKALQNKQLDTEQILAIKNLVDSEQISLNQLSGTIKLKSDMALTLDGIAKGEIAKAMSDILKDNDCPNHLIDAGGDLLASGTNGKKAWQVAIQHPLKPNQFVTSFALPAGFAIATSGNYAQGANHLFNPHNAKKATLASASVITRDCATADALATALVLMETSQAIKLIASLPDTACYLMQKDGQIFKQSSNPLLLNL